MINNAAIKEPLRAFVPLARRSSPKLAEDHAQRTKLPARQVNRVAQVNRVFQVAQAIPARQVLQLQRRRNSRYSKAPPPERVHNAPGKGASIYKFTQSYNQVRRYDQVRGEKPTRTPKLPAAPPERNPARSVPPVPPPPQPLQRQPQPHAQHPTRQKSPPTGSSKPSRPYCAAHPCS